MKQTIFVLLLLTFFFSACANSQQVTKNANASTNTSLLNIVTQTPSPNGLTTRLTERVGTVVALQTEAITPISISTSITPIPTSLGSYEDEITWHPQDILLEITESANDGNPWTPKWPSLRLYWDGTMIRGTGDGVNVAQLSQPQMCKLFNSIAQTGWFNVDYLAYSPVFAGTWAEGIGIHTWSERNGGGYLFTSALEGEGARDIMFCGDCATTSPHNFIAAAESNTYYLIYNNLPTDFKLETDFKEPAAVPTDYQITCKESDGIYPFVPVEQEANYVIFSSSGRRAIGILNQNSANVLSAVYKIDGSQQHFAYDPKSFGADVLTVIPRLWAKDNQYVYLTLYPDNVNIQPFHEAIALQQIDTNTGQTLYLFQGQANDFYSYALSNTGSRLAYIRQNQRPLELVLVDLTTGNKNKLTIESPNVTADRYKMAGRLQFNFSINKLLFSAIYEDQGSMKTTFFMVDLLNPSKLYVLDERPGAYKIKYMNYENDSPRWMEICKINAGLTGDDYCGGENVDLP